MRWWSVRSICCRTCRSASNRPSPTLVRSGPILPRSQLASIRRRDSKSWCGLSRRAAATNVHRRSMPTESLTAAELRAVRVRVVGRVQGLGVRPVAAATWPRVSDWQASSRTRPMVYRWNWKAPARRSTGFLPSLPKHCRRVRQLTEWILNPTIRAIAPAFESPPAPTSGTLSAPARVPRPRRSIGSSAKRVCRKSMMTQTVVVITRSPVAPSADLATRSSKRCRTIAPRRRCERSRSVRRATASIALRRTADFMLRQTPAPSADRKFGSSTMANEPWAATKR